jgi:hypothetical protein
VALRFIELQQKRRPSFGNRVDFTARIEPQTMVSDTLAAAPQSKEKT